MAALVRGVIEPCVLKARGDRWCTFFLSFFPSPHGVMSKRERDRDREREGALRARGISAYILLILLMSPVIKELPVVRRSEIIFIR